MIRGALTVAQKEFRHFLHDRIALALTLALPIFQLIFYGYALDTRIRHIATVVLNHDTHQAGRKLAQRLSHTGLFSVESKYRTQDEMQSALRTGAIRVGIEIPPDYTSNLTYQRKAAIRVWVDGSDVVISNYVLSALDALGFEAALDRKPPQALPVKLVQSVDVQPRVLFNPEGSTAVFIIPGLVAVLVQTITMVLVAMSISSERERGTLEQMLITPIGVDAILLGKALAIGSIGLAESCFLVLVMQYLFGIAVQGSIVLLLAMLPLLVLAPIGIGLFISALARSFWQALQLTYFVTLLSEMLSGFIFAKELLAPPIQWFSYLLPATYLIALARNVILRGSSVTETAPMIAQAAAFGVVLTAVGWYAARRSLA